MKTNKKMTKRSLILSMMSMALCVVMLMGTTYAWFTDSVTSSNNVIKSGNLDIELEYWNGNAWKTVEGASDILTNDLWEPGVTEVAYLRVANAGSLALKYQLGINIVSETAGVNVAGESFKLSDYIQFGVVENANGETGAYADREAAVAAVTEAKKISAGYTKASSMTAGDKLYLALVVYMPTTVGNEANHNGTDVPEINLGINVIAAQMTEEKDSFNNQYDSGATYPVLSNRVPVTGNAQAPAVFTTSDMKVEAPAELMNSLAGDAEEMDIRHSEPRVDDNSIIFDTVEFYNENGTIIDLEALNNDVPVTVTLDVSDKFAAGTIVKIFHDGEAVAEKTVDANGYISYSVLHFCAVMVSEAPLVTINRNGTEYGFNSIQTAMDEAVDGDVLVLRKSTNTSSEPLTETITVTKRVSLEPNGMYLVSSAPATFTVVEGGDLTVLEGSFTIKNTSTNGAAVLVDGGSFTMAGGSFDAHTAVRTTEGKSSTVAMTAGWSNRVTIAFDSKGNDTINVSGGSIYSSAESIKTMAGNHLNFNMSGGLLSSRTTQYSAAVNLQCTATVNMTGGKIENTYSSGYNGSSAIQVNVAPTTVNLSGTAALSSNGVAVMLGSHWDPPAVREERITFNMSGNSSISATSQMGFGIRYAQDNCDVTISGNAKVNATYQAIQFNTNDYVYTNSTLTVSENATINSTAGKIGGGYAIASNGHVTITGGTIYGSTAGVASFQEGAVVIIDNSVSGTAISINKIDIAEGVEYTVAGNPSIG